MTSSPPRDIVAYYKRRAKKSEWRVLGISDAHGWWALNPDHPDQEVTRLAVFALCERTDGSGWREVVPLDWLLSPDESPASCGTNWYAWLGEHPTPEEIEAEQERAREMIASAP